ncbi:MAG: 4-hydroxythreonine-4-phosphate dehydrogenase PdxA [Pyrinomonadaceae bacterium]|nr:4-hydroxythreonine-4-phosphate dehydrogenase PdxA [Pyrinomonadaceae bacterium]
MGDPAGIGAEIIVKAFADDELNNICRPVIIGDAAYLERTANECGIKIDFIELQKADQIPETHSSPLIYNLDNLDRDFPIGKESAVGGKASAEYIETAVKLWKQKDLDAITTAPINKKALSMGGYEFPGHTEFLASLTDTKDFAMSFFAEDLCVVLLSIHLSLQKAIESVKRDKLVELIRFIDRELSGLLKKEVKIAVSGLNPHASEGGMFGDEEALEIEPAVEECREKFDIDVSGPFSADTVFLRGFEGEFDAVVACYHDQATIAVKCLSFGASVNVTLGLPLIRTSVDHGTAYDIAGKNAADCSSLKAAVKLAAKLARIHNTP